MIQAPGQCDNCKRKQFRFTDSKYELKFTEVSSCKVSRGHPVLRTIRSTRSARNEVQYTLCRECYGIFVDKKKDWEFRWPSFLWHLLTGQEPKSAFHNSRHYCHIYPASMLWRMIPESMRPWWIDAISAFNIHSDYLYQDCTVSDPPSLFRDVTTDLGRLEADMKSGVAKGIVDALGNEAVMLPNVLCPFGCSEYCRQCQFMEWDFILQRLLLKTYLPLDPSKVDSNYPRYMNISNQYYREVGDFDLVTLNPDWPVMPTILWGSCGPQVLTCRYHSGGQNHLCLYPPRTYGVNMSAEYPDILSPIRIQQRYHVPTKSFKYCTRMPMCQQSGGYAGVSTFSVGQRSKWNYNSILRSRAEAISVAGRPDIASLLSRLVDSGQATPGLRNSIHELSSFLCPPGVLDKYNQGATYVEFIDNIKLQLSVSEEDPLVDCVWPSRSVSRIRRCWPRRINIIQTEDNTGFGTQFRPFPNFTTQDDSMMTWCLCAMLTTVKDLYAAVDCKVGPFYEARWEGHMLVFLQQHSFSYQSFRCDSAYPFKKSTMSDIVDKVNSEASVPANIDVLEDDSGDFFKFDTTFMRRLFPESSYPTIALYSDMEDILSEEEYRLAGKDIIICMTSSAPCRFGSDLHLDTSDCLIFSNRTYELRTLIRLKAQSKPEKSRTYDAVVYARHGNGFSSWWGHERGRKFATKYDSGNEILSNLADLEETDVYHTAYICVWVLQQPVDVDEWRTRFFKCMGGKVHVVCQCSHMPLIPTNRLRERKRKCMQCKSRQESFVCSNVGCRTRLCKRCYSVHPTDTESSAVVVPITREEDTEETPNGDSHYVDDDGQDGHDCDESDDERDDGDLDDESQFDNHVAERMNSLDDIAEDDAHQFDDDFLTFTNTDSSYEVTEDNHDVNDVIITTDAGDSVREIIQDPDMGYVDGHVLLNQAAVCLSRYGKPVHGTHRQKWFVQSLAATVPGETSPLLYLDGHCFPSVFHSAATHDKVAILGSLPLWALNDEVHPFGLASIKDISIMRAISASSTSSNNTHYIKFLWDILCNKALSTGDSRQILNRGFQVDSNSALGFSVRNREQSCMTDSVDSVRIVRSLAMSQKFIKWNVFFTCTCCHRDTPGVCHLHRWKRERAWTHFIPSYYETMSSSEQREIDRCFEEVYCSAAFRNWMETRGMFLEYIKNHSVIFGFCYALFSRTEYQKDSGNLPHEHSLFAIDVKNDQTRDFLEELVRTSVVEIIKTDEVQSYIDQGLLSCEEEYHDVVEEARVKLTHRCDERCKRRISSKDGEDSFVCRKNHAVWSSPDPTTHQHIPLPCNLTEECMDVLAGIGLVDDDGTVNHPYFNNSRHIAPCVTNATCNMSPATTMTFLILRSMVNVQMCNQPMSCVKYIIKYTCKFDQGNTLRIKAKNGMEGDTVQVGSRFLHNTKIASSAINEKKAIERSRDAHQFAGRQYPFLEILHLMLGLPEVTTNLNFAEIVTYPYELRARGKINVDENGLVQCPNDPFEDRPETRRDGLTYGIPSQAARQSVAGLGFWRHFTESQVETFKDHRRASRINDPISVFGLRPPELLGVFMNPAEYYRFCYIGKRKYDEKEMKEKLKGDRDLEKSPWIDCFGRVVRLRVKALDEALAVIDENLATHLNHPNIVYDFERREGYYKGNRLVKRLILLFQKPIEGLSAEDASLKEFTKDHFIDEKDKDLLPIPSFSTINPNNPQQFFIHFVLSHGRYETEMDLLFSNSPRRILYLAGLIDDFHGSMAQRRRQSKSLFECYFEEECQHLPNTQRRTGQFCVASSRFFDCIMLEDSFSVNEHPYTITSVYYSIEGQQQAHWIDNKANLLDAIYRTLEDVPGIPERSSVEEADRNNPSHFDLSSLVQSQNQTRESFDDQMLAIRTYADSILKYVTCNASDSMTLTKNVVVHGAPGTGKTFITMIICLFALSQGLNIKSTAIMAARADQVGGVNLHQLFCFTKTQRHNSPFRNAEQAMERLKKDLVKKYIVMSLDILFIDELGTVGGDFMASIDILLRKIRNSSLPYGGVLILGTLDHAQIGPVNALPFLISSLVLSTFTMVELTHSVRAHGDLAFQRFQTLLRMNPDDLIAQGPTEFRRLFEMFDCVPDWNHPSIKPNMTCVFATKKPVLEVMERKIDHIIANLDSEGLEYRISMANDQQKSSRSVAEYGPASESTIKALSNKLKEPRRLVLYENALYECTMNDDRGHAYKQSNYVLLVDLPSESQVASFTPLKVWRAPSGLKRLNLDTDRPSAQVLREKGWKLITLGCARENVITTKGNQHAKRQQYALRHVGASTMHKLQGNTEPAGIAVEIKPGSSPWEKGQVVVVFSRTHTAKETVIVGDREFAFRKVWQLATQKTQWTDTSEKVLDVVTINRNNNDTRGRRSIHIPSIYPYAIENYALPSDSTGFVYILISKKDHNFTYIGQTENIVQRLKQHNSGHGAVDTEPISLRPYALAGMILGLGNQQRLRMALEKNWRDKRSRLVGIANDSYQFITLGEDVAAEHNEIQSNLGNPDRVHFVCLVQRIVPTTTTDT